MTNQIVAYDWQLRGSADMSGECDTICQESVMVGFEHPATKEKEISQKER